MPDALAAARPIVPIHIGGVAARTAVHDVVLAAAERVHYVVSRSGYHAVPAGVGPDLVVPRAAVDPVGARSA